MPISRIKEVQGAGTFESQYGTDLGNGKKGFFRFEYTFEDGTTLVANHKSDQHYSVDEEVEYEITRTHPEHGNSGKVGKPQQNQSSNQRVQHNNSQASFALSYAKDIYCNMNVDNNPSEVVDTVTAIADGLLKWLKESN